jgi:mersacidin/lichenicidin family type 2 lantibiotic
MLGAVRDVAATFRGHLQSLEPAAIADTDKRTGLVFRNAIEVFRDGSVAAAFGLPPAPGGSWPMDGGVVADAASVNAAYLIQTIQTALDPSRTQPSISQHRFIHLQRAAHYGALTITGILNGADDWDSDDRIQTLVNNSYGWEKAMEALLPLINVVRVWKDPHYRHGLSACERAMISPHPSGEVDLKDAKLDPMAEQRSVESEYYRGYSTRTAYFEICCSTGDLCPTITRDYCGTNLGFACSSTGDNLTCINCEVA